MRKYFSVRGMLVFVAAFFGPTLEGRQLQQARTEGPRPRHHFHASADPHSVERRMEWRPGIPERHWNSNCGSYAFDGQPAEGTGQTENRTLVE
jgi:hypothetical protein